MTTQLLKQLSLQDSTTFAELSTSLAKRAGRSSLVFEKHLGDVDGTRVNLLGVFAAPSERYRPEPFSRYIITSSLQDEEIATTAYLDESSAVFGHRTQDMSGLPEIADLALNTHQAYWEFYEPGRYRDYEEAIWNWQGYDADEHAKLPIWHQDKNPTSLQRAWWGRQKALGYLDYLDVLGDLYLVPEMALKAVLSTLPSLDRTSSWTGSEAERADLGVGDEVRFQGSELTVIKVDFEDVRERTYKVVTLIDSDGVNDIWWL